MNNFWVKFKTALALGFPNIIRVLIYRVGVQSGLHPVRKIRASVPQGVFFTPVVSAPTNLKASSAWLQDAKYFGFHAVPLNNKTPDWFLNPFTGQRFVGVERPWWQLGDFDSSVGDIKILWEASRFDWVLSFAQQARNGNSDALVNLNVWLQDWITKNPPYHGPNWKCGQETSIRVMHLTMAALILEQTQKTSAALVALIKLHLQRVAPTVSYAIAQDNNHGTSEAAALFMGGTWLSLHGEALGKKWQKMGRDLLENRVAHLIGQQGTFSQYSMSYHRVMLDTLSMAEVARRHFKQSEFSQRFYERARAATQWLYSMVNEDSGNVPNTGANDGARLLPLTETDYRDFRPSVQLASVLFANKSAWSGNGDYSLPQQWLNIAIPSEKVSWSKTQIFDDGGFAVLNKQNAKVLFRYPRFKFRPSQADLLHVDLWLGKENILRDAGTYAYNVEAKWLKYFPGTQSHNTIQFDNYDQMPRLSRFLYGDWLKANFFENLKEQNDSVSMSVGYEDSWGAEHTRKVSLHAPSLIVEDTVRGFVENAVLRWRLQPGEWSVQGHKITNGKISLRVDGTMPITRFQIVEGWESLYYQDKTPSPVLEVEFLKAGTIITEVNW